MHKVLSGFIKSIWIVERTSDWMKRVPGFFWTQKNAPFFLCEYTELIYLFVNLNKSQLIDLLRLSGRQRKVKFIKTMSKQSRTSYFILSDFRSLVFSCVCFLLLFFYRIFVFHGINNQNSFEKAYLLSNSSILIVKWN